MPFFLYGDCPRCAVPICRPASVMQIGALPCGSHASSATGGAWSPPHEQERPGYHDGCALRRRAEAAGRAAHRHRGRSGERSERCQWQMKRGERVAAVKISSARRKAAQKFWVPQQEIRPFLGVISPSEARNGRPRPTFPFSWKSGEKSRQEPRFLHLLPRYVLSITLPYPARSRGISRLRIDIERFYHQRRCR